MNGLNFKDWEKISADKSTTTLRHKKGHVMTIAHSSLPRIQQEQLKRLKMADGGEVSSSDDVPEPNQKNAQDMQKGATESGWQPARWGKNLKEGLGLASNEAKGGMIKGVHQSDEDDGYSDAGTYARTAEKAEGPKKKLWKESALKEHKKVLGEIRDMKSQDREYLAEGGEAETPSPEPTENQDQPDPSTTQAPPATNITINAAPAPASPMMMTPIQEQKSPVSQMPQYPTVPAGQIPPPANIPTAPISSIGAQGGKATDENRLGIANQFQQSAAQQQNIDIEKAKQDAATLNIQQQQLQAKAAQDQQNIERQRQVAARLDAYAQAHPINPNAIYENMSVPGKVTTAIGLLLGGLGGGLNHTGQNPAMSYLMDQQAKDIQAQKDRMEQQKTIYGAYHELYGDDILASNMTAVNMNAMLENELKQQAVQRGSAQAAQAYMLNSAKLNAETAQHLGVVGQRISAIQNGQAKPQPYGSAPASSTGNVSSQTSNNGQPKKPVKPTYAEGIYEPSTMLRPGAAGEYSSLKFDPTLTEGQKATINEQYQNTVQADQALQHLPKLFNDLAHEATASGYIARQGNELTQGMSGIIGGNLGSLAKVGSNVIGGGLAAAQDYLGNQDTIGTNRSYDSDASALAKQISGILIHGGMDNEAARKAVQANVPEKGDLTRPEVLKKKLETIENLIKQYTPTGALEAKGWVKK